MNMTRLAALLAFIVASGCPLEKAEEAYARMMSGKAQFRVVLRM